MAHSIIYRHAHFLLALGDASASNRRTMLMNLTQNQLNAIVTLLDGIVHGVVSPMRCDALLFQRKRRLFRTLTSKHVSSRRKKTLLKTNHTLIPRLLRAIYLIQVALHEQRAGEE